MNSIVDNQNSALNVKRLEAQRRLYAEAKRLMAAQLILSVPLIIAVSFIALVFDKGWIIDDFGIQRGDLAWVVGAVGVTLALLDVMWFVPMMGRYREDAARIQQSFDCDVLDLDWNEIIYGKRIAYEDVEKWSSKYRAANLSSDVLKDWYSVWVRDLPIEVARIVCQRANCWWDMDLRKRYNVLIYWIGGILVAILSLVAFAFDLTLKNFFALILAPALPFAAVASKTVIDNKDSIVRLQHIKDALDSIWDKVRNKTITSAELKSASEAVQSGIFTNRRNNPLVFDAVQNFFRNEHEATMNTSTEQYVNEYRAAYQP